MQSCDAPVVGDNTAERWDGAYADEDDPPPWVIEAPQPEVSVLIERDLITGRFLDAGCGTGEHSLLAAGHGAAVTGVDISRTAIEVARQKAAKRGLDATSAVVNMLEPVSFNHGSFDTVLDSGVFQPRRLALVGR